MHLAPGEGCAGMQWRAGLQCNKWSGRGMACKAHIALRPPPPPVQCLDDHRAGDMRPIDVRGVVWGITRTADVMQLYRSLLTLLHAQLALCSPKAAEDRENAQKLFVCVGCSLLHILQPSCLQVEPMTNPCVLC